jgi:DNA-binding winged helix-turn-helix (wHTH) protein
MKVQFGVFALDVQARQLTRDGKPLHLSPKCFDLLTTLVERRPAVVEKAELRERLWPDVHVVDAALTNLVAEIRAVLGQRDDESPLIRTVHGVGYAFAGEAIPLGFDRDTGRSSTRGDAAGRARATPFWLVLDHRPIVLVPGDYVLGRDLACDLWVDADGVSRRHARIRVPAGRGAVTIEDLSSTNGTYVQGRRIASETRLANGDRVQLGHATLVFHARAASDPPTKRVKRKRA